MRNCLAWYSGCVCTLYFAESRETTSRCAGVFVVDRYGAMLAFGITLLGSRLFV